MGRGEGGWVGYEKEGSRGGGREGGEGEEGGWRGEGMGRREGEDRKLGV